MSFKIVIEETRVVEKLEGKEWKLIGAQEVERDPCHVGEGESRTRVDGVYGYTPEVIKKVEVNRQILVQEVDELDINAVICAINKIHPS